MNNSHPQMSPFARMLFDAFSDISRAQFGVAPTEVEEEERPDLVAEYLAQPKRCGRCGEVLSIGEWQDGAAEGCEDRDCPMVRA